VDSAADVRVIAPAAAEPDGESAQPAAEDASPPAKAPAVKDKGAAPAAAAEPQEAVQLEPEAVEPDGDASAKPEPAAVEPAKPLQEISEEQLEGIVTDRQSIEIIRPVTVSSNLPPVAGRAPAPQSPPPRPQSGPPGPPPAAQRAATLSGPPPPAGRPVSVRRPLPPPRDIKEIEVEPERRPLPPPRALTPSVLDEAEATARAVGEVAVPSRPPPPKPVSTPPAPPTAVAPIMPPPPAPVAPKPVEQPKAEPPPRKPWWIELFEAEFLKTFDNPNSKDVAKEADFIEQSLRLKKGARILDLACGSGVHAVELASRGYQVVGVDYSGAMLNIAQAHCKQRGQVVSFVQGDMRQLNLESVFDGIYCWHTSFGYFDDKSNAAVLERIARALRPGGMFALDTQNRDFVAPRSPSMIWFENAGCVCMDEMKFDFFISRMVVKRMAMFDTGKSKEIEYSIRLYGLSELGRLLHHAGFKVIEVSGHRAHRGAYFGAESPRLILVAERVPKSGS